MLTTNNVAGPEGIDDGTAPQQRTLIQKILKPKLTKTQFMRLGWARDYSSFILLGGLVIAGGFLSPSFLTGRNLGNILWAVSVLGIVALGQTLLIITAKFDMSVAFGVGLAGAITITAQNAGFGLLASILAGILCGLVVGLVNGLIVTFTNASPFLVTLGTMWLLYSIALMITRARTVVSPYEDFGILGRGKLFGLVHYSVVLFILLAIVLEFVLRFSTYGKSLYALGLNENATRLSGIRTRRTLLITFAICAMTAALAGLVMASRNGSTVANAGMGYEFESIIAVVLGGTSLFGGRGGALRTVVGVSVLGVLNNLMVLINFPVQSQDIVKGAVFLLIVWMDSVLREDKR